MVAHRSQSTRVVLVGAFLALFCFHTPVPAWGQEMKKYLQFDHAAGSSRLVPSVVKYQPDIAQARARTRPARQLNSLTTTNLQAEAANNYGYGNEIEYGGYASAGSHGGGHGHGHGGGGGHGVNSSAVGLLGFLALLSLIQNILRQMTTTPAGRRKRGADNGLAHVAESGGGIGGMDIDKITLHIIPHLMSIGQVLDGSAPLNCSMHALCSANKLLVKEIGGSGQGHFIGRMLSDGVMNMLTRNRKYSGSRSKKTLGEIANAAHVGRTTQNCDIYRKLRCGRGQGSSSRPWPGLKFSFPSWLG